MTSQKKKPAPSQLPTIPIIEAARALLRFMHTYYALLCVAILGITTGVWSYMGARLQLYNADQLVNPYLFESAKTFHHSTLPSQHTFLVKWPLFWLIRLFRFSDAAFIAVTMFCVLLSVGLLVYILWRLNRSSWVFGSLCLALASALLLVPAQPYSGGILPVNMAMLTTRNIEYPIFVLSVWLFIKSTRFHDRRFYLAILLSSLLIASDKLFALLMVGGSAAMLFVYAFANGWSLVKLSVRWFVGSIAAFFGGSLLLWILDHTRLVHISHDTGGVPLNFIHTAREAVIALIYSIGSLATNLGANPAFDARTLRSIPTNFFHQLTSIGGPAYIANIILLTGGLIVLLHLLGKSFSHNRSEKLAITDGARLSLALVWVCVAALGGFIFTVHYHPVDARYLTIVLFTVFIAVATYSKQYMWRFKRPYMLSGLLVLAIVFAFPSALQTNNKQVRAYQILNDRNTQISQALKQHKVSTVVGDYWRVLPLKHLSNNKQQVTPLATCGENRNVLTSTAWQPKLTDTQFAYLLSLDKNLTDFPQCSLDDVISIHGRPSSSTLIAGKRDNPGELLLYYDNGSGKSAPRFSQRAASTVLPVSLEELPNPTCNVPTIFNVVAHEDDDLLFMNPDIQKDIKAKHCIRTVYLTAGDAGRARFYWVSRQRGAESAYSAMLGTNAVWIERVVKLDDNAFVTIANPRGNQNVTLIFFNLPDGNLHGEGFASSHNQSLAKLSRGEIPSLKSVDGQSQFTKELLVASVQNLLSLYKPNEIRTQSSFTGSQYQDHSDHVAVSGITKEAYQRFEAVQYENRLTIPIKYYLGYPVHELTGNINGEELQQKKKAFFSYGGFDNGVCSSSDKHCLDTSVYGTYLGRQYQHPY